MIGVGWLLDRFWPRSEPRDDEVEDEGDDEVEDELLDGDVCPSIGCGCAPCALLARLCYHEAGHAIVYLALGYPFEHVYAGIGRRGDDPDGAVVVGDGSPIGDHEVEDQIVISLGGWAAEWQCYGYATLDGDDQKAVDRLLEGAPRGFAVEDAEAQAAGIVERCSDALDDVADALFEDQRLDYAEVRVIAGVEL